MWLLHLSPLPLAYPETSLTTTSRSSTNLTTSSRDTSSCTSSPSSCLSRGSSNWCWNHTHEPGTMTLHVAKLSTLVATSSWLRLLNLNLPLMAWIPTIRTLNRRRIVWARWKSTKIWWNGDAKRWPRHCSMAYMLCRTNFSTMLASTKPTLISRWGTTEPTRTTWSLISPYNLLSLATNTLIFQAISTPWWKVVAISDPRAIEILMP